MKALPLILLVGLTACQKCEPLVIATRPQLYVLMGDSIMVGIYPGSTSPDPHVFMYAFDGKWKHAYEPSHDATNSLWPPLAPVGNSAGYSCGLTFGKALRARRPSIQVGLVPNARKGSTLKFWLWNSSGFYAQAMDRVQKAKAYGDIAGVLIVLGANDASPELEQAFPNDWAKDFYALVANIRSDIGSNVPIVFARISDKTAASGSAWDVVRAQQESISIPGVTMISTDGFDKTGDDLHFSPLGEDALGRKFAEAFSEMQTSRECHKPWWDIF